MIHGWIQVSMLGWILFSQTFTAAGTARAKEIHVPADYKTIQEAITASRNGDTVIVAPERYRQNIEFLGRAITVRSTNPTDPKIVSETIIQGGELNSTINFWGNETPSTVLAGFTIIGTPSTEPSRPRGLSFVGSSPIVAHCTLVDAHPNNKNAFIRFLGSQASILASTAIIPNQLQKQNFILDIDSSPLVEAFVVIDSNNDQKSVILDNSRRHSQRRGALFQGDNRQVWGTSCSVHRAALIGQPIRNAPSSGWGSAVYDANDRPYVIYQGNSIRMHIDILSRFIDYEGDGVMSWPFTSEMEWAISPLNPGQIGVSLIEKVDPSLLPKSMRGFRKKQNW